jgi:hypothetical protein
MKKYQKALDPSAECDSVHSKNEQVSQDGRMAGYGIKMMSFRGRDESWG